MLVPIETLHYTGGMSADRPVDGVRFHRPRFLPGVELVSVAYNDRRFPEHAHEEYVVGAVTAGAEALAVGRKQHVADAGTVLLLNPAQAHANATIGPATLRYKVLYLPKAVIAPFIDPDAGQPHFDAAVSKRADLFRQICAAHTILASPASGRLDQESALATLVQTLKCDAPSRTVGIPSGSAASDRMRQFIEGNYAGSFGLQDLCELTGLSIFHLVRVFKKRFGLTPLAYRDQLRMSDARRRLLAGEPIAHISLGLGYADQSHFTRKFQSIVGTSPRKYARTILV